MADVWPFRPIHRSIEQLSWFTDVMPTGSSEARVSVRPDRQAIAYSYSTRDPRLAQMVDAIRANPAGDWLVPVWFEATRPQPVGASTTVLDVAPAEWGEQAIVWGGCDNWVLAEIASAGAGQITLADPVGEDFAAAFVMPVRRAYLDGGIAWVRRTQGIAAKGGSANTADLTFAVRDLPPEAVEPEETFDDLPVLRSCGVPEPLAASLAPPVARIDSEMGPVALEELRDVVLGRYSVAWVTTDRARVLAIRNVLRWLAGRDRPFWLIGWAAELRLASAIGASDTTVRVHPLFADLERYEGRVLVVDDGEPVLREITGAAVDGAAHALTVAALGRAISSARIGFARKVRLDSDLIELRHSHGFAVQTTLPVVEVPA